MSSVTFAERILLALALGIVIGIERQWRQRMAGLRTNALVAVGAALFASISILMDARVNPTQVAAYIVSGIGFLAGAVIFKEGFNLRGLNTAATLWATAAVGTLSGSGFPVEASIGAATIVGANVVLRPLVARINRQPLDQTEYSQHYAIAVICASDREEAVRAKMLAQIAATTLTLHALESHDIDLARVQVKASVATTSRADARLERIVGRLSLDPGIVAASWTAESLEIEHAPEE